MRISTIFLLLLSLLLSACTTTRTPLQEATPIYWSRTNAQLELGPTLATVIIVRDRGFTGSMCYMEVVANQGPRARINTGEVVRFTVPEGKLVLEVAPDAEGQGLCSLGSQTWKSFETTIRAGEIKYFRTGIGVNQAQWIPIYGLFVEHEGPFIKPYYESKVEEEAEHVYVY